MQSRYQESAMTDSPDNSDQQSDQQNDRHIKKSERLFAQATPELEHASTGDIALNRDGPLWVEQANYKELSGREIRLTFLIGLLAGLLYLALGLVIEKKTGVPLRYTGPGSPHLAFRLKSETTGQTAIIQRHKSAESR